MAEFPIRICQILLFDCLYPEKLEMADKAEMKTSPPDGVIRLEVDKASILDRVGQFSEEVEVRGVPWMINVSQYDAGYDVGNKYLYVSLDCLNYQTSNWSIDVHAEPLLVHPETMKWPSRKKIYYTFGNAIDYVNVYSLEWKKFIDNEKGFIRDDKITVEVRFWITNVKGVKIAHLIDFTDPNDPRHDLALVIDGEKIYVNKGNLSNHSPVFNDMFYGGFAERNQNEIELKDIDRKEFIEIIYSLIRFL